MTQSIRPVVYTTDDLKVLFFVSSKTLTKITTTPGFPVPISRGRWLRVAVDAWINSSVDGFRGNPSTLNALQNFADCKTISHP